MIIERSIRLDILVFLVGLTTVSIIITAYLGISSIESVGDNAQQITAAAMNKQLDEFLLQLTETTAEKNDFILKKVGTDAGNVAAYAGNIFDNPESFAREAYWKFDDHIFMGAGGQHLNGMDDVSSVFIPNYVNITEDLKKEFELNAYLDFISPKVLENNPNGIAIYTIGLQGESRYYPNIGLGNIIPPSDNPSEQIFFTVANPENNPEKKVAWTPVYDDPAGQGPMITASMPIYAKERGFVGVLGIDVTLNTIIKNIEQYNPIEHSYAFLIDNEGYSIALPEQAYKDILGREEGANESRASLNNITNEFGPVINKMKEDSSGIEHIRVNGKEIYVAYAPLKETGFSFGIVAEKEFMLKAVSNLQKEVNDSMQDMIYLRILPIGLFILIMVWAGGYMYVRLIVAPIKKLTKTAEKISEGNFNVKIDATSKNEIGQLASAFSHMAKDLKKSRGEVEKYSKTLEKQVEKRTQDLEKSKKELELKVGELERFSRLSVGRELKMIELKNRIRELEKKIGNK